MGCCSREAEGVMRLEHCDKKLKICAEEQYPEEQEGKEKQQEEQCHIGEKQEEEDKEENHKDNEKKEKVKNNEIQHNTSIYEICLKDKRLVLSLLC